MVSVERGAMARVRGCPPTVGLGLLILQDTSSLSGAVYRRRCFYAYFKYFNKLAAFLALRFWLCEVACDVLARSAVCSQEWGVISSALTRDVGIQ